MVSWHNQDKFKAVMIIYAVILCPLRNIYDVSKKLTLITDARQVLLHSYEIDNIMNNNTTSIKINDTIINNRLKLIYIPFSRSFRDIFIMIWKQLIIASLWGNQWILNCMWLYLFETNIGISIVGCFHQLSIIMHNYIQCILK